MYKIVYVILHYITTEDTIKCVDSIFEKEGESNFEIVIVDNNSPNNSGEILKEKYKTNEKIHLIVNNENLGFSKGNNVGFKYAKEKLNADFIVLLNNDVYIIQSEFGEKIINEYKKSYFAVLGPKIYLRGNTICNYPDKLDSLKQLKRQLKDKKNLFYFNKLYLRQVYSLFLKIKKIFTKKTMYDTSVRKDDVLLHGCCLIFSKTYIDKFDGLDDRTFLYFEEQLLYLRLKKNNLKSIYNPNLVVFHNEGTSTNKKVKNKRDRFDFVLKHEIDSLKILINEMEQL